MTNPSVYSAKPGVTPLPGMFQKYKPHIDLALRASLSRRGPSVYDMLRYYMGWVDVDGNPCVATEGKLLRPTLCLYSCEAAGGSIDDAMPAAIALELIHNFSLIHDDTQDQDEVRHHRQTLWAVWGVPKAIVAGNILRIIADSSLDGLIERRVDRDRALFVVNALTEAYLEMIEGQYLDISFEGRLDIGLGGYLDMIARKTGALIRCAMTIGAAIGSGDKATIGAFEACGKALGLAFQVRDDYLGVWGDETTTGKPVGADIRRKKNSFPVVYAMSQARGGDRDLLVEAYQKDELGDDDVAGVLNVMEKVNVREYAEGLAAEHCQRALDAVDGMEFAPEARREVHDLAQFLLARER